MRIEAKLGKMFDSALAGYMKKLDRGFEKGALAAADILLKESQKVCPIDTLTLRDTAKVRQEGSGVRTVAIVAYGTFGDSEEAWSDLEGRMVVRIPSEYARPVHEGWPHPHTHDPGKIDAYLKTPAEDEGVRQQMRQVIVSHMQ